MIDAVLAKVFGTKNEREVKAMLPTVAAIGALEPQLRELSDIDLAAKTIEFKERIAQGATLDDLLIEAFAVVREAGRRVLNMRHFDVQLIGGMVLHKGKIAEMKTGEGKTLVATLPCYLNALGGQGVHVVTVNDYLARRDSEWMGRLYKFLGLRVGVIVHDLDDQERKDAYNADITYGTNNEFGFDYLRDNMKFRIDDCVQRVHNFAIVDEVDSILIDEARTPLIISGPSEESTDKYYKINRIIPKLVRGEVIDGKEPGEKYTTGDYTIDEKHKSSALTEEGVLKLEKLLNIGNLYDPQNIEWNHHVQQALRAHVLYQRDREYVIRDGDEGPEVVIVDEFTGRLMPGRRWSDGLHQAVEAKEGVKIQRENQTLATITFQNYFRMYKKLAGMTGTAETEAAEFYKIYKLEVVVIPTNRSMIRKENTDMVYRTEIEKFRNAAKEIKEYNAKGQPVLVGTISVEKSEHLSGILKKLGVKHEVLNAKNHEREAGIVSQAGRKNAVTVSTNMAGRGTDILLGGNAEFMTKDECLKRKVAEKLTEDQVQYVADEHFYYFTHNEQFYRVRRDLWDEIYKENKAYTDKEHDEVVELGGLHIVATERHESRRIDNQLRGRAGRQGDPGSSRFYLSLQDDLLRIFGGERMQNLMLRLGMEEDVPIESKLITKRIQKAQEAVEAQNFEARKHLLEYDDVNNKQRQTVYGLRRQLLEGEDQKQRVMEMVQGIIEQYIDMRCPDAKHPDNWEMGDLRNDILTQFGYKIDLNELASLSREEMTNTIFDRLQAKYQEKEDLVGADVIRQTERIVMLQVIDNQWKDHLLSMDELKQGIGNRAYGQKDPLVEYKKESYELFTAMMDRIEDETVRYLFFLQVNTGSGPVMPYPDEEEDGDEDSVEEEVRPDPTEQQRLAAKSTMEDFTRNVQRKKEREMEQLQFVGGDGSSTPQQVVAGQKVGRNDPCPCGSGKKYKKCHGS
uniref:Protein translocase subunit SecA n=1 Tax=Solibacter usitatus (strain Ellin6076) TaxID=234267 RepID=SECA_SOLUE|nr:RecName: Full=Protein translocase subunit SecA [Candidatus Solibacter usitatus Ellin6076]